MEETGLAVEVTRLVGVYSNADVLAVYPDGNKAQIVVLCFEVKRLHGEPRLSAETTEVGYFSLGEMQQLPMLGRHNERVEDALRDEPAPIIR
jgi:ADP-ribose pyrophosphatase YjhB (NUDIX family)